MLLLLNLSQYTQIRSFRGVVHMFSNLEMFKCYGGFKYYLRPFVHNVH